MTLNFINEFKKFAIRGNVLDLAVGVIIGGAFGKIVSSLVGDIIMPFLGFFLGGINLKGLSLVVKNPWVNGVESRENVFLNYGIFLQNVIDFIIIALVIFVLIRAINKLREFKKNKEEKMEDDQSELQVLQEIRDILSKEKIIK